MIVKLTEESIDRNVSRFENVINDTSMAEGALVDNKEHDVSAITQANQVDDYHSNMKQVE